ncbi:MAG: anhydro-N-acetylmuramic acid kinase [Candidatus Pelagibacter sp.]|nr:anhydro-N-acetylmuramic acid kinase [Candidatus Pelagibacter sp.]OUW24683.1 MAG: hypothetical protein CBD34_00170 [Rickettsiales bacterium TMED174]
MKKDYISLGLMSGTSGDGVDASVIKSNGEILSKNVSFKILDNQYFEYDSNTFKKIFELREKINRLNDLEKFKDNIKSLERELTMFHAKSIKDILNKHEVDIIGFHGHTIYHNYEEKISYQMGDPGLLSQLTKKDIIFNFRKNDIKNGGQGAPLVPLFHMALGKKINLKSPWIILNIGGISNFTFCNDQSNIFSASDVGPGNCLIDEWIRENSNTKFDKDGLIANSGEINKQILQDVLERDLIKIERKSFDIKDFDLGFIRGLSIKDGAATITEYTAENICWQLSNQFELNKNQKIKLIISGGGRKNKFLMKRIKHKLKCEVSLIDDYGVDGDFVESQAFAFLAIRSVKKFPISYKWMTGCKNGSCLGGELYKFR